MSSDGTLREQIEDRLRDQFARNLGDVIERQLEAERAEAIERLLEDWEERRADELAERLSDEFEGGLGDAIEEELEALQAAE
jgi:hypothetical protein